MSVSSRTERLTLTLPAALIVQLREASDGNISRYVTNALVDHFEQARRKRIREELELAAIERAEEDLEIAEAFAYVEWEAMMIGEREALAEAALEEAASAR